MAGCVWCPCCRPPRRSSTPSALGDDLVGLTFECELPEADRAGTTIVVGGRDIRGMSPGEIDAYVDGVEAIVAILHPDAVPAAPAGSVCRVA